MRTPLMLVLGALCVLQPVAATAAEPAMPTVRSTAEIEAAVAAASQRVTAAVRALRDVPVTDFDITPHAGILVLSGVVNSEAELSRVLTTATDAADDVRVISRLTVRPLSQQPEKLAALQLVRRVELALQRDARTRNLGVSASIDEQSVIGLHGLVPSKEERALAEAVAKQVPGVGQVRNHLVVPGEDPD